jgi:hypothetical protein
VLHQLGAEVESSTKDEILQLAGDYSEVGTVAE